MNSQKKMYISTLGFAFFSPFFTVILGIALFAYLNFSFFLYVIILDLIVGYLIGYEVLAGIFFLICSIYSLFSFYSILKEEKLEENSKSA
jgi:hypothetical protein